MSKIVIAATPLTGHTMRLLAVAQKLVGRGHDVTVLTGSRFHRHAVTNGGYGGVQMALAAGVPIVVGGATEDKPFVAARVAAFGVGIDLGPAPEPGMIRRAVREVLADPSFKKAVAPIRAAIEKSDPFGAIEELILGT